jgi:hypothetical protein
VGSGLGTTIKHLQRKTRLRSGPNDQIPATHNERRRRLRLGYRDQVPATHNELAAAGSGLGNTIKHKKLRRGVWPGHLDQAPATHNWVPAWASRSSIFDAQRGFGLGSTIKYMPRTTNGAAGNSLGTTIKH